MCVKIDYKFSTVCEKNEKMSGPLGGIFFDSHCTLRWGMTPGVWTSLPSTDSVECTVLHIFYLVVHQKVSYTLILLAEMLAFYYSTDKIIRIMFIFTVSVIHCWLCSSTNHNSARCHLDTPPPAPSTYSVTQSSVLSPYFLPSDDQGRA